MTLNHKAKGFFSNLFSCDHKMIGTFYLILAIVAGVVGAAFSIILRLAMNGAHFSFLNSAIMVVSNMLSFINAAHALILIFFMVMPALIGGFANWLVPLMIGTVNLAFPRLNRLAFWLLPLSMVTAFSALLAVGNQSLLTLLFLSTVYIASASLLLTFVNFFATIITMRAPGLVLAQLPVFVWSVLISSFLGMICLPAMLAAVTQVIFAGNFPSSKLSIMLWFFSHPEIYVLLLPAFGIISQIISTFCKRPLYGESIVIGAMIVVGAVSLVLWTNNLFQIKQSNVMETYFFVALPLIGIPIAVISVSWFMTLVKGNVNFQTPMLWAFGFFFVILMGLISAFQLVFSTNDLQNIATTAFIAHFHYILSLGAVFAIFAAWYFWLPKMSGFFCRALTTKIHFWMMFIGVNAIFLPQHLASIMGDGTVASAPIRMISSGGALLAGGSVFVFLYGVVETFVMRHKVPSNPWGEGAVTLEWQLSSPPKEAWVRVPRISR